MRIRARDFRQNADGSRIDLKGVELNMFSADGKTFDRVRSEDAAFDQKSEILYSPGDVEITMSLPADPEAKQSARPVTIKTSGVRYESNTGKAFTDKFASFRSRGEQLNMAPSDMPGISVFARDETGTIFRTYSTYGRGIDMMNNAYHYLDLLPKGRDEAELPYTMSWVKLRDLYDR